MKTYGGVGGYKINSIPEAIVAEPTNFKYSYGQFKVVIACLVYMLKKLPLVLVIFLIIGGVIIATYGN